MIKTILIAFIDDILFILNPRMRLTTWRSKYIDAYSNEILL